MAEMVGKYECPGDLQNKGFTGLRRRGARLTRVKP